MPHVEISHFPAELTDDAAHRLEAELVAAVRRAFGVSEGAVLIGLQSVDQAQWSDRVYRPLISERADSAVLLRRPDY